MWLASQRLLPCLFLLEELYYLDYKTKVPFQIWDGRMSRFCRNLEELKYQKIAFYLRLQRWADQINVLNDEWFVSWNIMCVYMHHSHSDRNNILFLSRSCIYWMQKEKKRELRKVSIMHIILIVDFGLNNCDNFQKERTNGTQYLHKME